MNFSQKTVENRTNQAVVNHVRTVLQHATRSANFPVVPAQSAPTSLSNSEILSRLRADRPTTVISSGSILSSRSIAPPARKDTAGMPALSTAFSSDRFRDRLEV